jgi:V8-like Glu-specific endopeptidase
MRGSSVFASLALLTLGSCVPSRSQQDARSAAVNSTNGSGLPLPPNEASLLFTSTQISLEIVRPSPTSAKPFHGTPVSVQVLPPATTTPASSVKGANAQLPPVNQIAFTPANMHPFTGNGTNSTLTRRLVPRQACDPGIYCCPDPRQSYNSTQFPWVTIGRTQTTDPNGGTLICTGTMIGRRLVLTASHCINCKSHMLPLRQSSFLLQTKRSSSQI